MLHWRQCFSNTEVWLYKHWYNLAFTFESGLDAIAIVYVSRVHTAGSSIEWIWYLAAVMPHLCHWRLMKCNTGRGLNQCRNSNDALRRSSQTKPAFNSMAYVPTDCKFMCWRGSQNNLAKTAEQQWKASSGWYLNLPSPLKYGVFLPFLFSWKRFGKERTQISLNRENKGNALNSRLLISTSYQEMQGTKKREQNTE